MTVVGLLAGLALTWAGNDEAADVAWTIPAVVVAVRLAWAIVRDLCAWRARRRPHRDPGHRRGAPARRAVRRRGHRGHAGHRRGAGALCAGSRSPRTDRPPRTGAARTSSATSMADSRRPRSRRSPPATCSRSGPGEVVPVDGMVVGSPAVLDESALTGESRADDPRGRRPGFLRDRQCRLVVRSPCHGDRRRQRVRRDRPPRPGGTAQQGAIRPTRGPVCPHLRPVHPGHLRGRLARVRRPRSRPGRPGRGDAVPAPARRPDRDRRRDLPRGAARRDRQGRRSARDPGTSSGHAVRQDRNAHRRPAEAGHDRRWSGHGAGGHRSGRGPAAGGLGRATVAARARRFDRAWSPGTGARAVDARRRRRDAGRRRDRTRRRSAGRGGHGGVLCRRRRAAAMGARRPAPRRDRGFDVRLRADRRCRPRRADPRRPAPPRDPAGDPLASADRLHPDRDGHRRQRGGRRHHRVGHRRRRGPRRPSARRRRSMPSTPSGRTPPGRS